MFRILAFLTALVPLAYGLTYLADQPGSVTVTVAGQAYETSLLIGLIAVACFGVALMILWSLLRFGLKIPGLISISNRVKRRSKGFAAISRGMVAVGSGDARVARQQAGEAERLLGREPLTLLLKAQAAQLAGERSEAEAAFSSMLESPETKVLGLRGLFVEARRRDDRAAARAHAEEAHAIAPSVPWASRSVLEYACMDRDWTRAMSIVERSAGRNVVTRAEARRLRAVLLSAQAQDRLESGPDEALKAALAALKLEPGLVPAAEIAGRRLSEKSDFGKASKILETAWKTGPHPAIADAYVNVRRGDSALDRLKRAKVLARALPGNRESRFIVARCALDAREFQQARENLEILVMDKLTVRACLMMAELEDMEHGRSGPAREWLSRASRAPRDPVWVADGFISETWAPVSPVTGRIDAFEWKEPPQALEATMRAEMDIEQLIHHEFARNAIADHREPEPDAPKPAMREIEAQAVESPPAGANGAAEVVTDVSSGGASEVSNRRDAAESQPQPVAKDQSIEGRLAVDGAVQTIRQSPSTRPKPIIFPVAHAPDDPGTNMR